MKFRNSSLKLKSLVLVVSCLLIFTMAVAGTLAWLISDTNTLTNYFTDTDVDIELEESGDQYYDMIPGWNLSKDPTVTVPETSVDCWVFVKLEKSSNYDLYLIHNVDTTVWTQGDGTNVPADVYYRKVTDANGLKGQKLSILAAGSLTYDSVTYTWGANEVLVRPTVTKAMMNSLTGDTYPTLTVSSKAVQLMKNSTTEFTAAEAWALYN